MPEGDTIHRTAPALDRALAGGELMRFQAPRLRYRRIPPRTIVEGVEADLCRDDADIGEAVRQGAPPRGTYWCPACRPARSGTPAR